MKQRRNRGGAPEKTHHPHGNAVPVPVTETSALSLESALAHPLAGYVALPLLGAAVGGLTHPLHAATAQLGTCMLHPSVRVF